MIRQVRALGVPTVDLYHEDETRDIPGVATNQESLVARAIDHFLDRGFRQFAYVGYPRVLFSELRSACFARCLTLRGFDVHRFVCPRGARSAGLAAIETHVMRYSAKLAQWLRDLPKPVALLACNDMRGQQVLTVCDEAGILVPDEVAVLGVDNDDVQCEMCNPSLSSIDLNVERIGHEAAALLDRLFRGEPSPASRILVEPGNVVSRRSTDVLVIADRDVAEAVRVVRDSACDGAEIEEILNKLHFSRSTLDRWFHKWLGRTPHEELVRVRLERVKDLLLTTQLSMEEVAFRSGFRHVETMYRVVKRATGQTPGDFRAQSGAPAKIDENRQSS
jgi:LacI family transcriptional regulator